MSSKPIRIALAGAPPDTTNLGVNALMVSTLSGLAQRIPSAEFVVFDNSKGTRTETVPFSDTTNAKVQFVGVRNGKKLWQGTNLKSALALGGLGVVGTLVHPLVKVVDSCDMILDISGGDSFSDIYGWKRFASVVGTKRLAVQRRKPLILMPQTYGPYREAVPRSIAATAVKYADMCWARDERSFAILKDLLGSSFDGERHRVGVDVAFLLPLRRLDAGTPGNKELIQFINTDRTQEPVIGLNISGLIFNDPDAARNNYHFKADYNQTIQSIIERFLKQTNCKLVLIPHVMILNNVESDTDAMKKLIGPLQTRYPGRVQLATNRMDQGEVKWLISQMDWFCGTRMHATIAGLSTKTPTATINYSDKAKGVFESCGMGSVVFDPRVLSETEIVDGLWRSYQDRKQLKAELEQNLPTVYQQAETQMDLIAQRIAGYRPVLSS
ncbi:MAG: polysaccharide pyruvyl transferase family protein [Pirellula sp.]